MGRRILMLGGSGTIGRATVPELAQRGHHVTCLLRKGARAPAGAAEALSFDPTDPDTFGALSASGLRFDTVVSTLASRTGAPDDAWAIDYGLHSAMLASALDLGVRRMVLLSAICVQKPRLEFQKAKLTFEAELQASGLEWTIVRPTAFFKSLSGQLARVQKGKPFLAFGDGERTACKPISDRDLAAFLADRVEDDVTRNQIMPIGGPGPAISPAGQAALISELMEQEVRVRHVPVALLDGIIALTSLLGRVSPSMAARAELARIGRYYATESMLVWDEARQAYDADATPEYGTETLRDHYAAVLRGDVDADLGDHAMF